MKKLIIIGAGPAGCMAAISAKTNHPHWEVVLVDRNTRICEKLRLSGGGRCNISANVSIETVIEQTPRNGRFLYATLQTMNPINIKEFFAQRDLPLVEEDHKRLFPITHKADDVANVLLKELQSLNVKILYNTHIQHIDLQNRLVKTAEDILRFNHLIIASGGASYSNTGSDGLILQELKSNIEVTPLYPAETPLVCQEALIQSKCLQGLSLQDVSLSLFIDGKRKKKVVHDLLFTHFGLSGPGPLQCSSIIGPAFEENRKVHVVIDCLPNVTIATLETMLSTMSLGEVLKHFKLPKRLIEAYELLSKELSVVQFLKSWPIVVHDVRGFNQAFVTWGGVSVKEIDPKTLVIKNYPYLSVCGEAIDIHSHTGGFNITIAMSTGYHAGKNFCK
jgi:predicted Rossmann fold flavoprotein